MSAVVSGFVASIAGFVNDREEHLQSDPFLCRVDTNCHSLIRALIIFLVITMLMFSIIQCCKLIRESSVLYQYR